MNGPRFDGIEGEEEDTAPDFDAIEGEDAGGAPMIDPASISKELYGPAFRPEELDTGYSDTRGAVASVLQGTTMNWADEAAGLLAEQDVPLRELTPETSDAAYKRGRGNFRRVEERFRQENPKTALALSALGALASPSPGTAAPAFATRLAGAAASGALSGAGAAAEKEGMALGAAIGAPLGVGAQALGEAGGEVLGRFLGWIGQRVGGKVAAAEQKALEMGAEKTAKELASRKATLASRTQEANRFVENLLRLESTGALSGDQSAQLAALRQSGVLPALEQKLASSMLEDVPGAAGRIDIARSAYEGLRDTEHVAAQQAADELLSGGEAKRQVSERLKRYLPTLVGAAMGADKQGVLGGAAVGYLVGGTPGSALVGGLAGSALRPAGHALRRMASHPAVQRGIYAPLDAGFSAAGEAAESALPAAAGAAARAGMGQAQQPPQGDFVESLAVNNPQALGPYADTLQRAAAQGTFSLVHWNLQQTDPQYRAMLEALRKEQQ